MPYITPSGGGSGGSQTVNVASITATAAQLKNLIAAPKVLVAAPGADKIILPVSALLSLTYGGTAYDATDTAVVVAWDNDAVQALAPVNSALWTATQSRVAFANTLATQWTAFTTAAITNVPLHLAQDGGSDLTLGNSPVLITLAYTVVDLAA